MVYFDSLSQTMNVIFLPKISVWQIQLMPFSLYIILQICIISSLIFFSQEATSIMHDLMRKGHPVTSVHPVPPVAIDSVYKTGTTLSIYLSIYQFIRLSFCLSVGLSFRSSVCLSVQCIYVLIITYFVICRGSVKNEGSIFYRLKCTSSF